MNEWFNNKLVVDEMPTPGEIKKSNFDIVINVSDEWIQGSGQVAMESGIIYHWFPLNENVGEMGLNSIFAAMQILYIAEQEDKRVLLHCHAGVNRSPMIADCYYFMKTGEHRPVKKVPEQLRKQLNAMFGQPEDWVNPLDDLNLLQMNCELNHLPPLDNMERFLAAMPEQFEKMVADKGGAIDICKLKMIDDGED